MDETLRPGALIAARYEVQETLGGGSMGTVVRAADRSLDNEVCALKILHPCSASDPVALVRFRNEVILARRLTNPHIIRIHDFGSTPAGLHYISMEYLPGGSLRDRLAHDQAQRMSVRQQVALLHQVAQALEHAHLMDVVHRDLKPENILFDQDGRVKITDFGLARSLFGYKNVTYVGETVGTPGYMAPEQLKGEPIDGRCDIYALGILAFELLSGRRPFEADDYLALAQMQLCKPLPPLTGGGGRIPRWLESFVRTCAEKHPRKRYATASGVVDFLGQVLLNSHFSDSRDFEQHDP